MNKAILTITILFLCVNARVSLAQSSTSDSSSLPTTGPTTKETTAAPQSTSAVTSGQTASGTSGSQWSTTGVFTTSGGAITTTQNCPAQNPSFSVGAFFLGMLVALVVVVIGYLLWYFFYYRKHAHGSAYAHFS